MKLKREQNDSDHLVALIRIQLMCELLWPYATVVTAGYLLSFVRPTCEHKKPQN